MTCKTHPDAPHGFDRNASHSQDRYVCECESWEPPEQTKPMGVSCPRCGKTGLQPDAIHTCTPLALRLADILGCSALQCDVDAAAELRRLHAENEAAHRVGILQEKELMRLEAENEALRRMSFDSKYDEVRAENEALRDALKDATTSLETISRLAGKYAYLGDNGERIPTYMEHHDEVRGYAKSRASVARAALARSGEKT